MLEEYRSHITERAALGVPPKPLNAAQVAALLELLKSPPTGNEPFLLDLLENRVPPGVDEAAYVKAGFLAALTKGETRSPLIDPLRATELLGTMLGGYNVAPLIDLLDDEKLAPTAVKALSRTLLVFDAFHDVATKAQQGNIHAQRVLGSWAEAEWFTNRPPLPEKLTVTVFKVTGETNTDDLSPAQDAWSRPDIPLHAKSMLKNPRDGVTDAETQIAELKTKGFPVAYVGDVVGTGSSRKSATNSVLWHTGDDIPHVPNKRAGGICLGGKIAPIFFNTLEDSGALPIECDVTALQMGDVIDIYPYEGVIRRHSPPPHPNPLPQGEGEQGCYDSFLGEELSRFNLKTDIILDEVQAGGRIALIVGRGLTDRARKALGLPPSTVFRRPNSGNPPPAGEGRVRAKEPDLQTTLSYSSSTFSPHPTPSPAGEGLKSSARGYTLAQKIVGRACGVTGIRPGTYCEPHMTTVGSQDTTGPMTRDELKDLACLGFSADLVMQSFCHTAAYPKPVDIETHHTLPEFIMNRGGVSLRPGDGVIHSWLNRMLLPDTVGTGGDSHTRFPLGLSFPGGSGLVAFAAATGVMPLDMPESVLVRFKGQMQPGITLRDLVHAIPYIAIQRGLLTVDKKGKKNVFSGRILEIEGLPDLKVEQAFELSDASAERSAAACTIRLNKEPIIEYLQSNVAMLRWMIAEGYGDVRSLERRIKAMQDWLADPQLLEADSDAEYAEVIEIDLEQIVEPLLCCPNDPDDVKPLSQIAGVAINEVFIGSCMTNIGHFRAAGKLLDKVQGQLPTRLWVAPPTKMDQMQLKEEGYYAIYERVGVRTEIPGCSLCMGNQARVGDNTTVVSTSTRNFPNRLGQGANVYLASAELAAVCAILGRIPQPAEYFQYAQQIDALAADTYRYLNFDQLSAYSGKAA